MDRGSQVYKASVFSDATVEQPWYVDVGEVTGIVMDGQPMVRFGTALFPLESSTGVWRETEAEAQRDAWLELVRRAGTIQARADELRDMIAISEAVS